MTINRRIENTLSALNIPMSPGRYRGSASVYMVYSAQERYSDYYDDMPGIRRYGVIVSLFAPSGYDAVSLRRGMATRLLDAGFTDVEIMPVDDEDGQQIIFECEYAEEV